MFFGDKIQANKLFKRVVNGMDISKIDKNLAAKNIADKPDVEWHNIKKAPFKIYGLYNPETEKVFRRVPKEVASAVSPGVEVLSTNTAGGRVRFSTDSPYIALRCAMPISYGTNMSQLMKCGFDLYIDEGEKHTHIGTFRHDIDDTEVYASYIDIFKTKFKDGKYNYTVYFPLYNDVYEVEIGIEKGSTLEAGVEYKGIAPFVYYGSSITQGGCTSRPGNCYQGFISRRFDIDYMNLGFSGSALAEDAIVDYMSKLDMSIFISDYDHNAPSVEHLEKTHYKMYEKIRKANPDLPYIMISKPDVYVNDTGDAARRAIIKTSYEKALENGDKNVYFIDGFTLFNGLNFTDCTVDSCHPNDLGFFRMAQVIGDKIEEILKDKNYL